MKNPPDILKKIIQSKRAWVAERKQQRSISELEKELKNIFPTKDFFAALNQKIDQKGKAIIAEIKKASPSKGIIRPNFDPISIAKAYEENGAACLSVLTDVEFFQGKDQDLQTVRSVCSVPLLRKDFIIDPYQIVESRLIGADCILLIAAILSDEELISFYRLAKELKMEVLVEVHDEEELNRSLKQDFSLIGINNRNLRTFETSLKTTTNLMSKIPSDKMIVSESGIENLADIHYLQTQGVNAFLIGETLMKQPNPGEILSRLI